ncbi:FAD/NAD(P)-binding domain-containing protein [Mollisia scopiformis]|uniref:FAD/NAD(P)-binding domain-containing protein n=1 Tax=Mollisia scopiformis TaxID=149040 RepID=A0A194WZW2_MOLSC|nr:FAD/NAD(P)-binding domain-containing protein [Mollisia scopiformis]KUJ13486.1 FAD/NAD(P)-binding domain-containing protein [Mollisia scopiformis]
MPPSLPIIICGAGISGLVLGQGLKKANIPFKVFERDPALNVRSQGYRVRISSIGISALKETLPDDLFSQLRACTAVAASTPDEPFRRIDALTGEKPKPYYPATQDAEPPLNADRTVLRRVLVKAIEQFVSYGKEFLRCEVLSDDTVKVHFSDGTEVLGSLLVGADGTKSRVRKQLLSNNEFIDTEGRWFYGETELSTKVEERFNKHADHYSIIQNTSKGRVLTCLLEPVRFKENEFRKELPADYIYWVLGGCKDIFDMDDEVLLRLSPEEAATETMRMTKNWDPSFHILFSAQSTGQTSILALESSKPDIEVWETQKSVTLLGDSIHAMSPTAGVGSVTALRSAAALTKAVVEGGVMLRV